MLNTCMLLAETKVNGPSRSLLNLDPKCDKIHNNGAYEFGHTYYKLGRFNTAI